MTGPRGPLSGIRVLDLSRVLAGPFATSLLADLGAEVIKVERVDGGDDLRSWGPPFGPDGDSTYFMAINRNKTSIAVDLKNENGRALVSELAATMDVVVDNFRVGGLDNLGLGRGVLRAENAGIVCCSITGFGAVGPWSTRPGYDVLLQALSGLMSTTGEPEGAPMRSGVAIVDLCTGLYAAVGILAALVDRARTGVGRDVDTSLLETALAIQPNLTAGYLVAGSEPTRLGNGHPNVTPYGLFPTADGFVVIAIGNDQQWTKLCRAFGAEALAVDPRFTRSEQRLDRRHEVNSLVRDWLAQLGSIEVTSLLNDLDIPNGQVNSVAEALELPQLKALGLVQDIPTRAGGLAHLVGIPLHMSGGERDEPLAVPPLEAPSAARLRELGISEGLIARLHPE